MSHYDEDELAQYVATRRTKDADAAVEAHLEKCAECAARLALVEPFEEGLRDALPWKLVPELETGPRMPESIRQAAVDLERERAEAYRLLAPVVISPITFTRAEIDRDPRFRRPAVVEALASHAEGMRERQPRFALQLADTAIALATRLDHAQALPNPGLLGRAWTERMIALILIGLFHDAENAAARAEAAFDRDPLSTPHDFAVVWLNRAAICIETGQLAAAELLASAAAQHFAEFGDLARLLKARLARGNVLYMQGRYEGAVYELEAVVRLARRQDDRILLTRTIQSLGESLAALRRYERAVTLFAEAHAIAEESGADLEKLRAIWSTGNVLLQTGEFREAMDRLEEARCGFEGLGVVNDAALVRLQLAEALLALDRHDEVHDVLSGIAMTFAAEGMTRNATLALAYLQEASAKGVIHAALLQHVRSYLEELPTHPARPFVPLV